VDGETPTPRSRAIFKLFQSGELDILVGTQVMFQAQPMRYVGCVGLVYADAGLHLPDFQAGERTFHMLSKAVAMARPDGGDGCVVLQTYLPTHHVIEAVSTGTPALFYERELAFRRMLGYPPFTRLISLRVTGKDEARVKHAAEEWALRLRSLTGERAFRSSNEGSRIDESSAVGSLRCDGDVQVLGPIPSSVARIRGRYRWQLLVKSESGEAARLLVLKTLEQMKGGRSGLKYEIDVDPLAIL
jgi:primosomal protein N' (replication factor Y)